MKRYNKVLMFMLLMLALLPLGVSAQSAQDEPAPVTVQTEIVQQARVNHEGVRFSFDASLADAVTVVNYPASEDDSFMASPAYTRFTFEGYGGGGDFLRYAPLPRVDVFAIEGFGPYPYFIEQLDELSRLLAERPDLRQYAVANPSDPNVPDLPHLPLIPAAQVFRTHPVYIELDGLTGIRYLVYYSQAMNPIADGEVYYTFQGITGDGQHYISAVLPVATGILSEEDAPLIDDPDTFAEEYLQYLQETVQKVSIIDGDAIRPSLSALDALVQSIRVNR